MTHHNDGGRYTTNFIEDIKPPIKHVTVTEDRSGLTNFRPFEEIAQTVQLGRPGRRVLHKKVWIDYNASASPVNVQVMRAPTFGYTFVPPLTNRDFDWHRTTDAYYDTLMHGLRAVGATLVRYSDAFVDWVSQHITAPILVAASAVMGMLFGTSYTIDQGVQRRWKTGVRAYALATVLALFVIVGSFLLLNRLLDQSAHPGTRTATSSSHISQQVSNTSTRSSSSSSKPSNQTGASAAPTASSQSGASQTAGTASAGSIGSLFSNGTTGGSGGGLPVGGYGGGGSVPSAGGTSTPSTPTAPVPSGSTTLPNPATLIPYNNVTVPPVSVGTGGKQVLGTSPVTLTTN